MQPATYQAMRCYLSLTLCRLMECMFRGFLGCVSNETKQGGARVLSTEVFYGEVQLPHVFGDYNFYCYHCRNFLSPTAYLCGGRLGRLLRSKPRLQNMISPSWRSHQLFNIRPPHSRRDALGLAVWRRVFMSGLCIIRNLCGAATRSSWE